MAKPQRLETGLRTIRAGIPYTLLVEELRLLGFQLLGFYCKVSMYKRECVCVCMHVCVYIYIYIYMYNMHISRAFKINSTVARSAT